MPKAPWLLILRIAALVALAASAALLSDYLGDSPSFCSVHSGCGAVRASSYSHVQLGGGKFVPLPAFGVAGFATLLAASLLSRPVMLIAAGLGGAVSLWLFAVQAFVLHQYCWLCITVDLAGVLAAVAALALSRSQEPRANAQVLLPRWVWWALGAVALGTPLLWPRVKASPAVPSQVLAYYKPDKLNVVEFADFQCPACRRFHDVLKPVLKSYGDRVHFVRLNKPLASHAFARDAARAAICAETQGKLEPMADALFAAPDLSPGGIDRVAASVGLDAKSFEACLLAAETEARVERESALLVPPELEGLPTTYIGGKRLLGVRSREEVEDALERAARGEGNTGIAWYVYLPAVTLLVLLLIRVGLRRRAG
ncbi:MAG TPA: thioredoxin domain-containing protein [Polyangiaceae bacterium]|nr:thioredoxin domain-containing protein [Polyangiaceae bacterium]